MIALSLTVFKVLPNVVIVTGDFILASIVADLATWMKKAFNLTSPDGISNEMVGSTCWRFLEVRIANQYKCKDISFLSERKRMRIHLLMNVIPNSKCTAKSEQRQYHVNNLLAFHMHDQCDDSNDRHSMLFRSFPLRIDLSWTVLLNCGRSYAPLTKIGPVLVFTRQVVEHMKHFVTLPW